MSEFFRSRLRAFRHAFRGLWYVIKTQRNAWIHAVISILVVALSLWLGLSKLEWVGLILTIAFVWMAEIINTALEAVVDLASPQQHPLARVGKDVGARSFAHGRALFDLGLLYQLNGKNQQAQECLAETQHILTQCNSETYAQRVQQALAAMR